MPKSQSKKISAEEIAEKAERGEDVSRYFKQSGIAKQRVNVDFPLEMLRAIDEDCKRIGITRQSWIKTVCREKLLEIHRITQKAS